MSRARWIALGVVLLLVLGVVALYWFNTNLSGVTVSETDGRRTWIVPPGETVTVSADEVRREDQFRCEGIDALVEGTPGRSQMVAREGSPSGVITVETAEDGDVTVSCDPDSVFP